MLKSLYIKNYALIDSLEIDFDAGFSVITGETGAGKSIILGAMSLILGQRADIKSIKQGEAKCVIEGIFDVSAYDLRSFYEENDIEYDASTCIFRREILSAGKSRAFINDSPVSLNILKELGAQLIDIHSQHQNLLLGDARFQMQVLDILAGTRDLLKEYSISFKNYKQIEKALNDLKNQAEKSKENEEYLRFQFDALAEANLIVGEQEDLEKELEVLNNAEDIKSSLFKVHSLLSADDNGVVQQLKDALHATQSLKDYYPKSQEIAERLETAYIDLRDLSGETEKYAGDIEFSQDRLNYIQSRLDLIYGLEQKYRLSTINELIDLYNDIDLQLKGIDSFDQQILDLEKDVSNQMEIMLSLANKLSEQRQSATKLIEQQLIEKVSILGIPNVSLKCELKTRITPDLSGIDDLSFLFSANKNIPLQPISDVASGGEISRVMLCLKSMIAGATTLPTIIFDEIDTGVSGEVADKMGQIMQEFGSKMQVMAITHLPQIAAKGKTHYFVYKSHEGDTTSTNLRKLSTDERVKELSQMLSGSQVTDAAIENAKAMLGL